MTEAELQALIAQFGGEIGGPGKGRYLVESTEQRPKRTASGIEIEGVTEPNPTPDWVIETTGGTLRVRPQPDGTYLPINIPNVPRPGSVATQQGFVNVPGVGLRKWDEATQSLVPVPGGEAQQAPRALGAPQGGVFYERDPETGQVIAIGAAPGELARLQAQEQRAAAAEQRAQATFETNQVAAAWRQEMDRLKMLMDLNQIDEKQAKAEYDRWYQQNVELPAQQLAAEEKRIGAGLEYARQAGEAAVKDVTELIPYRYSPGFLGRRQAAFDAARVGNFQQGMYGPIAGAYRGPDLAQTRARAQAGAQRFYERQFGFEPLEVAGEIPYRAPVAAAVPGAAALSDDEELIKQFARQMIGGAP
jgi:hypothetical protein